MIYLIDIPQQGVIWRFYQKWILKLLPLSWASFFIYSFRFMYFMNKLVERYLRLVLSTSLYQYWCVAFWLAHRMLRNGNYIITLSHHKLINCSFDISKSLFSLHCIYKWSQYIMFILFDSLQPCFKYRGTTVNEHSFESGSIQVSV